MSQANRKKRAANASRRSHLDLTGGHLTRPERRRIERDPTITTLAEIRVELAQFSRSGVMDMITSAPRDEPAFLVARLVREIALGEHSGGRTPSAAELHRLILRLGGLFDPTVANAVGGNFSEVAVGRISAPQMGPQRDHTASFHRIFEVFVDPHDGVIGEQEWRRLLGGMSVPELILGVWTLSSVLERGPLDLASYHDAVPELEIIVRATAGLLTADLDVLRETAGALSDTADAIYPHGPLLGRPIYERDDGRVAAPSTPFVRLAASPPALYVRLLRADTKDGSRQRSDAVGRRFQSYLHRYLTAGATDQWQIRDLDSQPKPVGRVADIAIWPEDRSFVMIVEAKTTLQAFNALLGNEQSVSELVDLYQSSFDQIHATVEATGRDGFLLDAPTGVPVFGLTVTLDLHFTSVVNNRTLPGLVLDFYRTPTGASAGTPTPSRVIAAEDFEIIADLLAWAETTDVLAVLENLFGSSNTRSAGIHLTAVFGDRLPDAPPMNPLVTGAFQTLAETTDHEPLRSAIRSIAASL